MRRAPVHASLSPSLHPALRAALSSLDVQLEAELTRYRRQRHLQRRRQHDAKPMNVIAVQAVGGRTQPQVSSAPAPAPVSDADPWQSEPSAPLAVRGAIAPSQPPVAPAEPAADLEQAIALNSIPDPVTVLQSDGADQSEPDDYLASSEELLRSLAEEEADLRRQRQSKGRDRLLTPLGIGSLLLLLLSSATLGYLVLNPGTLQSWNLNRFWNRSPAPPTVPASESPAAIAPSVAPSPDLSSQEFHDLNLDTLSTLPMSPSPVPIPSATAIAPPASVAASPSPSLPPTRPAAIPARPRAIAAPTPNPVPPTVTIPRRTVPAAPPAQRSSRAQSTPATRPVQPRPTARSPQPARPAPVRPAARPIQPARPAPQAARPVQPAPRRSPAARPVPPPAAPPASAPAARPNTPPRYVVVSPYSGDRSLEQAQRVVGDAYVRNLPNGAQVQYGAFSDGDRARELSQQLQQQGISAQVVEAGGN